MQKRDVSFPEAPALIPAGPVPLPARLQQGARRALSRPAMQSSYGLGHLLVAGLRLAPSVLRLNILSTSAAVGSLESFQQRPLRISNAGPIPLNRASHTVCGMLLILGLWYMRQRDKPLVQCHQFGSTLSK